MKTHLIIVTLGVAAFTLTAEGIKCIECLNCNNATVLPAPIQCQGEGQTHCIKRTGIMPGRGMVFRACIAPTPDWADGTCSEIADNVTLCNYICQEDGCNGSVSYLPPTAAKWIVLLGAIFLSFLGSN